jgi:hypothetical protein
MRRDAVKIADFRKISSGIFFSNNLEPADAIDMLQKISVSAHAFPCRDYRRARIQNGIELICPTKR